MDFLVTIFVVVIIGGLIWFLGAIIWWLFAKPTPIVDSAPKSPVYSDDDEDRDDPNWEDHIRHDPYHPGGNSGGHPGGGGGAGHW